MSLDRTKRLIDTIRNADVASDAAIVRTKLAGCPGVRVGKTADQTITRATWSLLTWDLEAFDTDGYHSNVTNNDRITIPAGLGGYYVVHMFVVNEHDGGTAVGTAANIELNGDGTFGGGGSTFPLGDEKNYLPGYGNTLKHTNELNLADGDVLRSWAYHDGTTDPNSPRIMAASRITLRRIGPAA